MIRKKVALGQVIEALEFASDSVSAFYCVSRNEFVMLDHEARGWIDDQLDVDDAPQWMQGQIEEAKKIEEGFGDDYYPLPDRFEIDEYHMMTRFTYHIHDVDTSRKVADALKARGAYRNFRNAITDYGLLDQWYAYRDHCYKEIAIDWCRRYGIEYI